jgi:esterase/lipase superfamily enzyme
VRFDIIAESHMTDSQILQTARKVLPLLDRLLGTKAPTAKKELQKLLAQARRGVKGAAQKILDLLKGYPAIRKWMMDAQAAKRPKGVKPSAIKPAAKRAKPARSMPLPLGIVSRPPGGNLHFGIEEEDAVPAPAAPSAKLPYDVVTIHFATDREPSGKTAPSQFFTGNRAKNEQMTYGTCDVSIPPGHKKGGLEGPSWLKLEFRADPKKHVVLLKVSVLDPVAFFSTARQGGPQALVFVHGFRVTFEDGARRMAQIARDLHPFVALPILYSWPSRGKLASYSADREAVEWTVPHLQQFLEDLTAKSGMETVHIMAHSMGNQAVTRALKEMAASAKSKLKFHQVVLTAPDVDAGQFRQLAREFLGMARRVTMYANAADEALAVSKKLQGFARAGDAKDMVVLEGMDSVDATDVDNAFFGLNHSYFGEVRTVITDIRAALQGLAVTDRDLEKMTSAAGVYYRFAP